MVFIWQYGECMMSSKWEWQGKRKDQVEFSTIMVGTSIVGVVIMLWIYATYYALQWFMNWILK